MKQFIFYSFIFLLVTQYDKCHSDPRKFNVCIFYMMVTYKSIITRTHYFSVETTKESIEEDKKHIIILWKNKVGDCDYKEKITSREKLGAKNPTEDVFNDTFKCVEKFQSMKDKLSLLSEDERKKIEKNEYFKSRIRRLEISGIKLQKEKYATDDLRCSNTRYHDTFAEILPDPDLPPPYKE